MRLEGSALRHSITLALSLLPTPLLVFVSSSSAIYLKNQSLLQYQYQVLTPFAKFAFVTLLVGIALAVLSKYRRLFQYGLWVYYLAGPVSYSSVSSGLSRQSCRAWTCSTKRWRGLLSGRLYSSSRPSS